MNLGLCYSKLAKHSASCLRKSEFGLRDVCALNANNLQTVCLSVTKFVDICFDVFPSGTGG